MIILKKCMDEKPPKPLRAWVWVNSYIIITYRNLILTKVCFIVRSWLARLISELFYKTLNLAYIRKKGLDLEYVTGYLYTTGIFDKDVKS